MADGAGDARRAKPGIVTIPGLKQTYEGFVEDQVHGQWAYYCYVGVTGGPVQNVATQLRDELAKKYPAGLSDWKDVSCNSPDGQALKWRQLRLVGKQDLYYKNKDGKEQSPIPNVDGVLEIYLYEKGPQVVIVAWRMPASIEPNVGLAELAPLVAGSVNVK
jgi:hypothetical protein